MKNTKYIPTNLYGWVIDPRTGAVINTNVNEKKLYEENIKHEREISDLKQQLKDIQELINRVNKDVQT